MPVYFIRNLLISLLFLISSVCFSAEIEIYDVKGRPGKCRLVVEHQERAIEWFGDCANLEDDGTEFVLQYLRDSNEKSSSDQRNRPTSKNKKRK